MTNMVYKMTQAGHIVRINLPNNLPKEFIASVEENPKGEKFLECAKNIIKNAKIVYDF
jgi:hypothetical protein